MYEQGEQWGRDYYPAKLFHKRGGDGEKLGFKPSHYCSSRIGFYAEQATRLFRLACEQDIFTFDFYMKRVQLKRLEIPGTILLIDEAQDMDGCQIDWVTRAQISYSKHVYVVGDPAQAIYGFRGAKSQHLMDLNADQSLFLLGSFRFGQSISNIANCILFAKEKSDQTGKVKDQNLGRWKHKNWKPYRVRPAFQRNGVATAASLISDWKSYKPITLIARANATLFSDMLEVLIRGNCGDDEKNEAELRLLPTSGIDFLPDLPKVHILGEGENSGRKAFANAFRMLESLCDLYKGETMVLPEALFPEFEGSELNYHSFTKECENRELSKYNVARSLISKYGGDVTRYVNLFKTRILDNLVDADHADIILTTCHCSKGLEWENVQISGDFAELCKFDKAGEQFAFGYSNDEINALYVACTRAKSVLSIPPSVHRLLRLFDDLHNRIVSKTEIAGILPSLLSVETAFSIHERLIMPLRGEFSLAKDASLEDVLVTDNEIVTQESVDREAMDDVGEHVDQEREVNAMNSRVMHSANDEGVESTESCMAVPMHANAEVEAVERYLVDGGENGETEAKQSRCERPDSDQYEADVKQLGPHTKDERREIIAVALQAEEGTILVHAEAEDVTSALSASSHVVTPERLGSRGEMQGGNAGRSSAKLPVKRKLFFS